MNMNSQANHYSRFSTFRYFVSFTLILLQFDAIVTCYFNSAVPPRIHADVTEEIAASIIEKGASQFEILFNH